MQYKRRTIFIVKTASPQSTQSLKRNNPVIFQRAEDIGLWVVVGMTSNGFTLADPNDRGMLDVVGFDTTVPAVIADFVRE